MAVSEKHLAFKKASLLFVFLIFSSFVYAQNNNSNNRLSLGNDVIGEVDVVAEFLGGINKARLFIANNLNYPAKAQENDVEGTVQAKFVIEKYGTINNIEIVKKLGYGCDEEVIRVLKRMPKWKPAQLNGLPVRSYYTMPVSFKM